MVTINDDGLYLQDAIILDKEHKEDSDVESVPLYAIIIIVVINGIIITILILAILIVLKKRKKHDP